MIPQKAKDILARLLLSDNISDSEYDYFVALLSKPKTVIQNYTQTSTNDSFRTINTLPESKL